MLKVVKLRKNIKMKIYKWANERIKQFIWVDIKLVTFAGIFLGLILAKLVPTILGINVWWFVLLAVLCILRPYYVIFSKKSK